MSFSVNSDQSLLGRWELEFNSGRFLCSDQVYKIFGLEKNNNISLEEIIDRYVDVDSQAQLRAFFSQDMEVERPDYLEIEITRVDNEKRTLQIRVEKFDDGNSNSSNHQLVGYILDITPFKLHEQELIQSEKKWRTLTQNTPDIIMHTDLDCRILYLNFTLPEHTNDTVVNMTLYDFVPDQQMKIKRCVESVKQTGNPGKFYLDFPDPMGNMRYYEAFVSPLKENDEITSLIVAARDITERRAAEEQMVKLSRALENTADTVLITDVEGNIEYVNSSFEKLTKCRSEELLGQNVTTLACGGENDFYRNFLLNMHGKEVFNGISIEARENGQKRHVQKTVSVIKNPNGEVTHYVSIGKDITDYMLVQEKLQYLANHDVLTQLPNRSLFFDRLEQALARAHWHNRLIAVLFVDIDRFKYVNDTLGHETGDRLLQKITRRLLSSIREGDTVARLGGDEFAILLDDVANADDVSKLAQKIVDSLKPEFNIDGRSLQATASVGVSLYPNDGNQPSILLKNADMAMYRAKDLGKNNFQYYSDDLSARAFERLNLENKLRRAIAENQLEVYYQPQYDFSNKKIIAMEALLRWNHPELGVILPAEFIYLLEETSLIIEVGDWVLSEACRQIKEWHCLGFDDLSISVNFSSRQFSEYNLVESIEKALGRVDLAPELLEIEITETLLINNVKGVAESLNKLSRLGVRLALDDFGTGYSSLSYLKRFPIHTLKIDRSFVHDITRNNSDTQITKAIIAMSKMLNLQVIAEGVEQKEQLDILLQNDCSIFQGYYFKEPMPAEECTNYLHSLQS